MILGILAHVDAGKTTLSEALLHITGAVRSAGRVDHGNAFLDTNDMEKERGITIFSKQARFTSERGVVTRTYTLQDTPGHVDFSTEMERVLGILDCAVLVISAADGVQSHTRTLWHLLARYQIPTVLFVNKMDRFTGDRAELLAGLHRELSDQAIDFSEDPGEKIALCDEACLDAYLREGAVPDRLLRQSFFRRSFFPCFFGAALRNEGVEAFLAFLSSMEPPRSGGEDFGAAYGS